MLPDTGPTGPYRVPKSRHSAGLDFSDPEGPMNAKSFFYAH